MPIVDSVKKMHFELLLVFLAAALEAAEAPRQCGIFNARFDYSCCKRHKIQLA
jgi:hypothetical protein